MVSLTFDEFHAIRSRQRATAEAEASTVAAKTSSEHAPSSFFASGKPVVSKADVAPTRTVASSRSSSKLSESSSSHASPSPAGSGGRSNGASDGEIAPTSGSVREVLSCYPPGPIYDCFATNLKNRSSRVQSTTYCTRDTARTVMHESDTYMPFLAIGTPLAAV